MKSRETEDQNTNKLLDYVVQGIREKKGHDIVTLNMKKLDKAVCDYFVICHGTSDTQVEAISEFLTDFIKEKMNSKPHHVEGMDNAEWVLLDYFNVVVHIFQKEARDFYQLEDVWADAEITALKE
ncbi:MAG: ribosome silencing factor [Bacteroidales bacterium]